MKLKRWLTILLFTIIGLNAYAQGNTAVYPVEVTTFITPPYGTCLKDFVGSQRFQVHVLLRDLSKSYDDFVIVMSVKNMGGTTIFRSKVGKFSFANGSTMIVPAEVNTHILHNLFNPANIEIGGNYATDCFPEGAYNICFQAYDAKFYETANRRIPVSRESVVSLFMQGTGDKAYLVYPYANEVICDKVGGVINYQWQPANPTGEAISYHLEVVELNSDFDKSAPARAFDLPARILDVDNLYSSIYPHIITETNSYKEGHSYAWRVTINKGYEQKDKNGEVVSSQRKERQEIRVFEFRCNPLDPPVDTYDPKIIAEKSINDDLDAITLKEVSYTGVDALLKWQEDSKDIRDKYCGVGVEIRKFGGEQWTAFKNSTTEEFEYSLSQLSRNVDYQVRAHYIKCPQGSQTDTIYGPYSQILEFNIPRENDESECGKEIPDLADCTDRKGKVLRAGDTIFANGEKVFVDKITEYSADSTEITGEGHISFPIITNIQLKMKFDKIKINCEGQLEKGEIHAVNDPATCAMIDLEELTGEGFTGGVDKSPAESKVGDMKDFGSGSSGDYFKGDDGTVYMKDENGQQVQIGKVLELDNTQFSIEKDMLGSQYHFVYFKNPYPNVNAFDNDEKGYYRGIRGSDYSSYSDKYIIPYLANNPGRIKTLNAYETRVNDMEEPFEDVKFIIETDNGSYLELDKEEVKAGDKLDHFVVKVPGTSDCDHLTYVRVIGKPKGGEQYQIAGKMIVCNYKPQTHNLIIVPTLSEYKVDENKVKEGLNNIYGRLGITFNVTVDHSFENNQAVIVMLEDGLDISTDDNEKHSWDVESEEMQAIRSLYQQTPNFDENKRAAYLFLVSKPEDKYKDVAGDMPRNQSVGYIFMGDKKELSDIRLVAHELGHGVFRLQHTFAYKGMENNQGETDNLMDYEPSNPDFLAHYQWNVLADSAFFVWKALQDDEDGQFNAAKCAIDIVVGGIVDAGFEAWSQYSEDPSKKFDWGQIGLAALVGAPSRLVGCFDPKGLQKVLNHFYDAVCKGVKANQKCNYRAEHEVDTYWHCMCEESMSILSDEFWGVILETVDDRIKNKNKLNPNTKNEYLTWLLNSFGFNFTVDGLSNMMSSSLKNVCGENPLKNKKETKDPNKPKRVNCVADYYVEQDADDLITIYVETISDTQDSDKLGLLELELRMRYEESECNSTTNKLEKVLWNNNIIYDYFSIPSEETKFVLLPDPYKNDENHYVVSNLSAVGYDRLYLVSKETEELQSNANEQLYYVKDGKEIDLRKVYKNKYLYKLRPSCLTPSSEDRFIEVNKDFYSHLKLSKWDDDIVVMQKHPCSNGKYCGKSFDTKPSKKVVVETYPKYSDDECSGNYNKSYINRGYIKNPFGQVVQTSKNEYENKNPRENNEKRLGIPKCSRWKETETGYSVSCLDINGTLIEDLFTVDKDKNKAVLNQKVASSHQYFMFETWGDDAYMLIDKQHNCKGNACDFLIYDLDDYVNALCRDSVQLFAFTAMYVDYMVMCNGQPSSVRSSNIDKIFASSLYEYIKKCAFAKNANVLLNSGKTLYLRGSGVTLEKFIGLLPEAVRNNLKSNVAVGAATLKKTLLKTKPKDFEFVVTSKFLQYATYMTTINKDVSPVSCTDKSRASVESLSNYLSMYGWMIFNDSDGGLSFKFNTSYSGLNGSVSPNPESGDHKSFEYDASAVSKFEGNSLTPQERAAVRTIPTLLILKIKEYLKK